MTEPTIHWGWPLVFILAYVSIGPAIIAMRCWGLAVQRVGASRASFFSNLSPLFAAVMSSLFLGELPQVFHAVGFVLIICGIILSSRH
jgi:drug/metabolite transporter (DMT)-like permease